MSDSDGRAKGMEIPETVEDLADILLDQNYLADRGLATATYLALCLGRPLLLEGEAGVGKTELAKAIELKEIEQAGGDYRELLQELEDLSDEEARALLAEEQDAT